MPRAAGWEDPKTQADMLAVLRGGGSRKDAASAAGVSIFTLDAWYDRADVFRERVDRAEALARERGAKPTPTPSKRQTSDRFETLRNDAAKLGDGLFGLLLYVDGMLSGSHGFPVMPPWWRFTFQEFYASAKRWLVVQAARGGGKSTIGCRATTVECIFSDHSFIGPGESAIWPLFSVDMAEANSKIGVIVAILDALGIEYQKISRYQGRTAIVFEDSAGVTIEVRVYPATVTAASGPTLAGCTLDEEAKYKNSKEMSTDSAEDVLATIGPAFRARVGTHGYRFSSPWLESGTHYDDIQQGSTENNHVARLGPFVEQVRADLLSVASQEKDETNRATIISYAESITEDCPNIPTWLANPSISPIATRKEARTFDAWMREYVGRASGSSDECYFDGYKVGSATMIPRPHGEPSACFAAIDPGASNNAFALAIVGRWGTKPKGYRFAPMLLCEWIPAPGIPLDIDRDTLPEAAAMCVSYGCDQWTTDGHAAVNVRLRGAEGGLSTSFSPPDIADKEYDPARRALHRGDVSLAAPSDPRSTVSPSELRRQLGLVRARLGDNGKRKIVIAEEKGKAGLLVHGDVGRAFVRALAAAGAGALVEEQTRVLRAPSRYAGVMRGRR